MFWDNNQAGFIYRAKPLSLVSIFYYRGYWWGLITEAVIAMRPMTWVTGSRQIFCNQWDQPGFVHIAVSLFSQATLGKMM